MIEAVSERFSRVTPAVIVLILKSNLFSGLSALMNKIDINRINKSLIIFIWLVFLPVADVCVNAPGVFIFPVLVEKIS